MSFAARLRCLRRSFLRHRSHVRAHRWSRRAAASRASVRSPSVRSRSAALRSSGLALTGLRRGVPRFFFPRQKKKKKKSARPARGFGSQNGAQTLQPLQTTCGSAGVRLPCTPTPDCERDVHAGRVRGIGAIRGSRPCTRGAHVKPGAHLPSRCVGSFHSPLQKLAASPAVSRRRARSCRPTEGRGRLGGRLRPLPRPARGRLGAPPKGVDHVRASPHHVAHPAPLSLDHQQELLDASVREAEARSSRCWDHEPATCRVWDPSVACDQHLTLWRTQRRTFTPPHGGGPRARARRGAASSWAGGQASEPHRPPPTRPVARLRLFLPFFSSGTA